MKTLQPHEAALVRRVYEEIAGQPWFNRNAVTERELLKLILNSFAGGIKDEKALLLRCRGEARERFSLH